MASQSTFRTIFKICPKSTKFTSSSGVEEEKFIKVEPPTDKNKVNENKHSCGHWFLDLKNEWKTLSVAEAKQLLLKEIHGSEWLNFWVEDISKSLEKFWLNFEQLQGEDEEPDVYAEEIKSLLWEPHDSLMRRKKHQRLTYPEKLNIFTRYMKEGVSVRQLWADYQICRNTISHVLHEFKFREAHWNRGISKTKRHLKTSPMIIDKIANFKRNWSIPFVVKDVTTFI